jgi:hypothetical protein
MNATPLIDQPVPAQVDRCRHCGAEVKGQGVRRYVHLSQREYELCGRHAEIEGPAELIAKRDRLAEQLYNVATALRTLTDKLKAIDACDSLAEVFINRKHSRMRLHRPELERRYCIRKRRA